MSRFDFAPLYRSTIGFDRVMRALEQNMREPSSAPSYPPYNIATVSDDRYRITMAVAGFSDAELDITAEGNRLTISGKKAEEPESDTTYLHRGIAARSFDRQFELADHVEVGSARLENGLLHVELLRRVPEALRPRKISIGSDAQPALENQAA